MFQKMVKNEIEMRTMRMLAEHPALAKARAGELGAEAVGRYLASVRHFVAATMPHLKRAIEIADANDNQSMREYFSQKLREETGHEKWADSDMGVLGGTNTPRYEPLPSAQRLVDFIERLIETDTRLYVVYILSTEYFTVLGGPTWVHALQAGSGIPADALTVVTKHVAADAEHAEEGFVAVDQFCTDPHLETAIVETVAGMFAIYDDLFHEVADVGAN